MGVLIVILFGAAFVALLDGAALQAIGIAAFAGLLMYLEERARSQGRPRWWIGFGVGRFGQR